MKNIKLECKTQGFSFGDVAEVGNGKGQISLSDAKSLVKDGMAKQWDKPVNATSVQLKNEVTKLTNANKALEDKAAADAVTIADLEAKLVKAPK